MVCQVIDTFPFVRSVIDKLFTRAKKKRQSNTANIMLPNNGYKNRRFCEENTQSLPLLLSIETRRSDSRHLRDRFKHSSNFLPAFLFVFSNFLWRAKEVIHFFFHSFPWFSFDIDIDFIIGKIKMFRLTILITKLSMLFIVMDFSCFTYFFESVSL